MIALLSDNARDFLSKKRLPGDIPDSLKIYFKK